MPSTRTLIRSFAGGEMSPEMFGRIDDVKFQSGAATMRNFIATPQGPAENRPGTTFVREVKDSTKRTRLIPFTFSTTQTMVIEIGAGYFRFHTNGATLLAGSPAAYSGATAYVIGDLVSLSGTNYYCVANTTGNSPPNATYWYPLPSAAYEIPNPYAEADLFDIHHVQSSDILTLVHPNYEPRELRRISATSWKLTVIDFDAPIAAPASVTGTGYTPASASVNVDTYQRWSYVVTSIPADGIGESVQSNVSTGPVMTITAATKANPGVLTLSAAHGLRVGDKIYISGVGGMTQLNDTYYYVNTVPAATTITLKTLDGVVVNTTAYTTYTSGGSVTPQFIATNLYVTGAYVSLSWAPVTGASRYNVYKLQGGIYGYIGQTSGTSIVDDNIAPDLGVSPPNYDNIFASANNYPGAVSYFEQRRCFAGTINDPQKMWMTKSGTESNMSYSLPIKDDDRIAFKVAARESNTIRHIVPLSQLVLLTSSTEWRVTSVNSDAITPTSISVQPQSYIGASNVQPSIINNAMVYCSARGGHVRELGYSWQSNGFITGDLSLRTAHLFDDYEIVDMCYSKAPKPIIWFVSSSGYLLGLTYVPEQQIGAWHWHDTDGVFESCTTVAEGAEDVLYVIVRRTINNVSKRYVERMTTRKFTSLTNAFFVDSGSTYDGTNTTATTVTVTTGAGWTPSDSLTITASSGIFSYPGTSDVGDQIVLTGSDGIKYLLTILATSSSTVATARVNRTLATEFRATATSAYSFARNSISGLTWLEGKTVSILTDGAVHPQRTVTSGTVTLEQPGTIIHIGLPYESDLQSLPMAMQIDGAFGQGRVKNVNKVTMRVYRSSGIFIGPNEDNLIEAKQRTSEPYGSPPSLKTQEIDINLTPDWTDGGQVFVRQQDPLPLTIINLSFEVAIGG